MHVPLYCSAEQNGHQTDNSHINVFINLCASYLEYFYHVEVVALYLVLVVDDVTSLYPTTLKSAGYNVIPSIQKIAFECQSVCLSVRLLVRLSVRLSVHTSVSASFSLCWEHFLTNFLQTCYES